VKAPSILVVDDHEPLREALRHILENEGFEAAAVPNGKEALLWMEAHRPDAVVSDILMPQMDGYEFYRAVRERQEWTAIPFVFLTVKADREEAVKARTLGADAYLTKPLEPSELVGTIRGLLKRAEAIQAAAAAEFEELKDELVTVLGHELRTPLTYIRCYADMALRDAPAEDEQVGTYWAGVRQGADRLTRLAEDIEMLVQLGTDQGRVSLQDGMRVRPDVTDILTVVGEQYEALAARRGITLETTVEPNLPPLRLDAPLFVDALSRLLDNAIKFSRDKGKRISFGARCCDGSVEVSIADEGVGIAPDEMDHLFDRLHQIERDEMEQDGLGLGLFIARRLIDLHDGEITVESMPGEGSTFLIRMPLVDGEA
jgi:signal transduction histidine kinase